MARWTKGQEELDRVSRLMQALIMGANAKGLSLQLKDGTKLHGRTGNANLTTDCAATGLPNATSVSADVVIHTDNGDQQIDVLDIEHVMVR